MLYQFDNRLTSMRNPPGLGHLRGVASEQRGGGVICPGAREGRGTLSNFAGYGAGNPRFFVSGRFTSLVNCGELVNPLNSLGELDVLT